MSTPVETTRAFEACCYDNIARSLFRIADDVAGDIYALSFLIYDDEDDPDRPTLTFGYNTNKQWKDTEASASSSAEAKWNYAFWIQNALIVIGQEDSGTLEIRDSWIRSLLPHYEKTQHFVNLCVRVARRLHTTGTVQAKFGSPIPILVHELEYYDEIAHQNCAANPGGIAEEFVEWVLNLE